MRLILLLLPFLIIQVGFCLADDSNSNPEESGSQDGEGPFVPAESGGEQQPMDMDMEPEEENLKRRKRIAAPVERKKRQLFVLVEPSQSNSGSEENDGGAPPPAEGPQNKRRKKRIAVPIQPEGINSPPAGPN
jgi:hypothetical protein